MGTDYGKTILEVLKLAPRYLIALAISAGLFLFVPDKWLKVVDIYDFAHNYRPWFAITFVFSCVLLVIDWSIKINARIKHSKATAEASNRRLQRLHRLTEAEKQILRFYIQNNTRTNVLRIDDGVVNGLVTARIIFPAANVGNIIEGLAHNISDFAWDYLQKHQHLLAGTTTNYRTDKRDDLW